MKQKILMILVPILGAILAILSYFKFINTNISNDSIKFKNEYEEFNEVEVYGNKYQSLNLSENNPIKYSNYDEILDIIENKDGIVYLGFPECPWCRTIIPVLFEAAKENDIKTIYYLNIKEERDSYVIEDGKLVYELNENGNEKKGTEGYFKLMRALDKHLTDYTISFEGKTYETEEKRIYAPTVIFVKNGKILGIHVSSVDSQISGFDELTAEQEEELYSIYEDYILKIKQTTCSNNTSC